MYYVPRFVKQVSDLEYGSVVTHENYNEKLNLNMEQGDYNTEVLRILFTERDIANTYRIPYLEKYTDDAIDAIKNEIKEHVDQIEENKNDIATNKKSIATNSQTIADIITGKTAVQRALYASSIMGIQAAADHTYYGKDYDGKIGFHAVPDGIFAEDISSSTAEINGIYYVPRADSVEEGMLTDEVRAKLNRTSISSYSDLTNKPSINNVTLSGNVTLASLGVQPAGAYLTDVPDNFLDSDEIAAIYLTKDAAEERYTPLGLHTDLSTDLTKLEQTVAKLSYNRVCIGTFEGTPKVGDLLVDL
jgi:hypothetical protein